jgi:hypothetical protein
MRHLAEHVECARLQSDGQRRQVASWPAHLYKALVESSRSTSCRDHRIGIRFFPVNQLQQRINTARIIVSVTMMPTASATPARCASKPCSVRSMAVDTLDSAGIAWTEVFVGGGVSAIGAAVSAGRITWARHGRKPIFTKTASSKPNRYLQSLPHPNTRHYSTNVVYWLATSCIFNVLRCIINSYNLDLPRP